MGANTCTGGTTIAGGTLQIGNGGPTGSIVGNVTDNGALVFDRSGMFTFGGSISGAGSLAVSGSGTLTLTGSSSYASGTTVNPGAALESTKINGSRLVSPLFLDTVTERMIQHRA